MKPRFGSTDPSGALAGGRSLGGLFRDLSEETSRLVRQEIALARSELSHAARAASGDLIRLTLGIALAATGGLALVAAAVVILGTLLGSYWLSSLLVGLVLLAGGGWGASRAVSRLRKAELRPRSTLESLRDTGQWARHEAAEVRATLLGPASRGDGGGRTDGRPAALRRTEPGVASTGAAAPTPRPTSADPRSGAEGGRGDGPNPPPPREAGLLPFLKHVGREIGDDDVTGQAAKLAYYAFLAMPPALMALFGIAGLVGSEWIAGWLQQQASMVLPQEVNESIIQPFIQQVVLDKAPGPLSIGLLLALWGGSSVFAGLMDALNHAYDVEEDRSFVKKRAIALGVMVGGALLFLLAAVTLLVGPEIARAVGVAGTGELVWNLLRWPLTFGFVVAAFWIGYYVLPNRDQGACKKVLLRAAAAAALLWVVATAAFRLYIANFSSYSETYGFLGAFIILLLWLYVTGLVVLAGGELASEMERRA